MDAAYRYVAIIGVIAFLSVILMNRLRRWESKNVVSSADRKQMPDGYVRVYGHGSPAKKRLRKGEEYERTIFISRYPKKLLREFELQVQFNLPGMSRTRQYGGPLARDQLPWHSRSIRLWQSMTLKSIAGIVEPDSGSLSSLDGRELFNSSQKVNLKAAEAPGWLSLSELCVVSEHDCGGEYPHRIKGGKALREAQQKQRSSGDDGAVPFKRSGKTPYPALAFRRTAAEGGPGKNPGLSRRAALR